MTETSPSKLTKKDVKSGAVGGTIFSGSKIDYSKPLLVLFNQWRSNSTSILSKSLAETILDKGVFSAVLFMDRIASGGASDETLAPEALQRMQTHGEFQFAQTYAKALQSIAAEHKLPKHFSLGGSSAGGPAALACAKGFSKQQKENVVSVILVEPSGLRKHGIGKKSSAAVSHAFVRHLAAYRHRISRGWWTPMDKEQYFNKSGKMFEYRAKWWAADFVYRELVVALADPDFPQLKIILSNNSHVHSKQVRDSLKAVCVTPHKVIEVTGNHDKICQPPSLAKLYSGDYGVNIDSSQDSIN